MDMNGFEECVSCRYLSVMKLAQPGLSIEHYDRSDGDDLSVPNNGCFEHFGLMPFDGHPCVPGKSK